MKQMRLSRRTRVYKLIVQIASVYFFITLSAALPAQSLVPELVFINPQLMTGPGFAGAGQDGAVYMFSNVGVGIDALVSIQGRSSDQVGLTVIDLKGPDQDPDKGTGYDNAWQPIVSYGKGQAPAHSSWWMEFKISFVKHDHPNQSAVVNQFFVSGLDIDGDGQGLHEFLSFYRMQQYSLEPHSAVYAVDMSGGSRLKGKRFDGPVKNYKGINTAATDVMANGFYKNTSSIVVRLGGETGTQGSKEADRKYALWFRSLTCDLPTPPAISQTSLTMEQHIPIPDFPPIRNAGGIKYKRI